MSDPLIFSFDLGTGSLGECVRQGKDVKLNVLLMPSHLASIKEQAKRRRLLRTRQSHHARENWWREQAKLAGLEVLETRQPTKKIPRVQPDSRMLREFPSDGDKTIYTSCLLRIALLQNVKLEGWQIFKAVWSALQHRGYDLKLPWKTKPDRKVQENEKNEENEAADEKVKDERENREATKEYEKILKLHFGNKKEFCFPCYVEALRMGIWNPEKPDNLSGKIGANPGPARNKDGDIKTIPPRQLVENELRVMLENAAKQFPKLKQKVSHVLYGPGEKVALFFCFWKYCA